MSPEYPIVVSPTAPVAGVSAARPNSWASEPPEQTQESAGAPIARIISAILRYKWLTLGLVVAGAILGALATNFIQPTYEARAKLWVVSSTPTRAPSGPIMADQLLPQNSWVELFQSFAITDSVVAKRGLAAT